MFSFSVVKDVFMASSTSLTQFSAVSVQFFIVSNVGFNSAIVLFGFLYSATSLFI